MTETPAAASAPIIIKRIKKGGHGHHGGQWKVAYADFVTAMMAFFLLLWLLSVTTQDQRKAVADYFTPTIGIKDSKGIGIQGGKSPGPKGNSVNNLTAPGLVVGQVQQGPVAKEPNDATKDDPNAESTSKADEDKKDDADNQDNQDSQQFKLAEEEIKQALESDPEMQKFRNSVQVEDTQEGLKINLIDDPKKPMFSAGSATLTEDGRKVVDSMANIVAKTANKLSIIGHTDLAGPTSNARYSNWELSADRANAVRRILVTTQVDQDRVAKVVGMADRELLVKEEPNSPRNRRVTIVLMRGSYFRDPSKVQPAGRAILSVPEAQVKEPEPLPEATPMPESTKPSIFDQN